MFEEWLFISFFISLILTWLSFFLNFDFSLPNFFSESFKYLLKTESLDGKLFIEILPLGTSLLFKLLEVLPI